MTLVGSANINNLFSPVMRRRAAGFERGNSFLRGSRKFSLLRRVSLVRDQHDPVSHLSNFSFERGIDNLPSSCPLLPSLLWEKKLANRQPPFAFSANAENGGNGVSVPLRDLSRLIDAFILSGDINGHSPRTLGSRRERLSMVVRYLESVGAESFGTLEIRQFLHFLRHGHEGEAEGRWGIGRYNKPASSGTVKSYHSTLRTFCNWMVSEGELVSAPTNKIPTPVDRPDQVQPFTDENLRALIAAAKRPRTEKGERRGSPRRDEAILLTLLDTGMRASELVGLTIADVDLMECQIRIRNGKGGKARTVPFSRDTKRALYHYINERTPEPDEYVFLSEGGHTAGEGMTPNGLYQLVDRWGEFAKIEGVRVSPHTFRHTFAVSFLRAGGNVFTLKEILGHSSLTIVNRYVAIAQADITRQHAQFSPVSRLKASGRKAKGSP